ncbi:MAG: hypothetical protein AB9879_04970 [Methanothrix sp.]
MSMLMPIGIIMASGAVGGIINALVSDNGFIKPREETAGDVTIIRPGFAGNILLGAAAAFISWGLYGAFSNAVVYGSVAGVGSEEITVSISAIAGAVLVGIGGARWLTNEVDKKLLRTAAAAAAASKASFDDSQKIAVATPAQAFNIAKKMYQE